MPEINRRRLLGSVAGTAAASLIASYLPPNLQKAAAATTKPGSMRDIEHIVVLTLENRSFDHYFGALHGVRGFDDPDALKLPNGQSVFYQPDAKNPDGYLLPWHLDTHRTSAQAIPSTSHAWSVQHQAWNNGKMDNWLPAHRAADGDANGPYTMGYYEWQDIPFDYALAHAFTLCDGYHCSLMGPTWPNRLYLMSGTIDPDGVAGGPIISNVVPQPYRWKTYAEQLEEAGVSWRVYQEEDDYGCNPLEFFQSFQDARPGSPLHANGLRVGPPDQFEYDVQRGRLPTVSWIIPTSEQSSHPAYLPAAAADFVASKLDVIAADPNLFAKTVFIINYDENDGLFDHVPPPVPPAGTPHEFVGGLPIGGGFRVPCTIVSPWTRGGWVVSDPFDHTSVLQFMERVTGVRAANVSDWRRQTFGDLTSALGVKMDKRFPPMPPTLPEFWLAEYEAANLPKPALPGGDQTPPHQQKPPFPLPAKKNQGERRGGPLLGTASRLDEVTKSARADFPDRGLGTNFPGIQEAVSDARHLDAAAAVSTPLVYVASLGGTVSAIDRASGTLLAVVKGLTNPYGIAAATLPGGAAKLYATNSGANTLSVIDRATNKITNTVTVGVYPHGVAASPDGTRVYVANTGPDTGRGGSRTVSVLDTASEKVVATFTAGEGPHRVVVSPDGHRLYVTCHDGLYILDAAGGGQVHAVRELTRAQGVALTPDGKSCYVTQPLDGRVSVVDTARGTVTARVTVGRAPWEVAFTGDGTHAYVSNANDDTLSAIDTATHKVVATVTVGHIPTGVAGDGTAIWVANNTSSTITKIDTTTNTVAATTALGLSTEPASVTVA
ncbi:MAG TPA: alkaline phosphatase family protein [Streptosporangiaceae bacterium]